ncbi:MAG: redoxin domain-containing protein [Chloroflexi bacterium]|nr:redoxin domain-containing protein [Chloroflexota bacterium]
MKATTFFGIVIALAAAAFVALPVEVGPNHAQSGIVSAGNSLSGDVNCDGSVSAIDAALVLQSDAGLIGSLPCPESGDVNQDGSINALDATLILQFVAGLLGALAVDVDGGDEVLFVYTGADVLGGEELTFANVFQLGKPVVVHFWAGLCPPCRREMPEFQELYDERQDEFLMLGVDVGRFTGLGSQDDALDLLDELGISYPTVYVESDTLLREYNIFGMPGAVFLTASGDVVSQSTGFITRDEIRERTQEMIDASE